MHLLIDHDRLTCAHPINMTVVNEQATLMITHQAWIIATLKGTTLRKTYSLPITHK